MPSAPVFGIPIQSDICLSKRGLTNLNRLLGVYDSYKAFVLSHKDYGVFCCLVASCICIQAPKPDDSREGIGFRGLGFRAEGLGGTQAASLLQGPA